MLTEQKIETLAQEIILKTVCPQVCFADMERSPERAGTAGRTTRNGTSRFITRPIFLLCALLCLGCVGAGAVIYYFSCGNAAFRAMEESGYVTVLNQRQEKEGVTLVTEAVLTDGAKTYVRIRAKGLSRQETVGQQIREAYLVGPEETRISYGNIVLYENADSRIIEEIPALIADDLAKDEMILLFYYGPQTVTETTLDFHIAFSGMEDGFAVEDIPVKVPLVTVRDTSDMDLILSLPFGEGEITQIIYTGLETYFDIKWTLSPEAPAMLKQTREQYEGVYVSGDARFTGELPLPELQAVKDTMAASKSTIYDQFVLHGALDPRADLVIQQRDRKTGDTVGELLKMEGMEP